MVDDIVQKFAETGTSHFRLLEPLFSMVRNFPNDFNLIYTEQITPSHLNVADLLVMHRADQRHSFLIDVTKKFPKTSESTLICHDVDDNEFQLPKNHSMRDMWLAYKKDQHSLYAIQNSDLINIRTKLQNILKKTESEIKDLP